MRTIHIALVVVFISVILIFAFQNIHAVTIAFLGLSASAPLSIVIIVAYLLGMATGGSVVSSLRRSFRAAAGRSE